MLTAQQPFGGESYRPKDHKPLKKQLDAVRSIMLAGGWHTLGELKARLERDNGLITTEASVSARLRDLRKLKYGAYMIDRRPREGRLYEYRLWTSREGA